MKRLISALSSLCLAATSLLGAFPGITASAATVKADAPANTIVYDLVPQGKDYTPAAVDSKDNNLVKVTPGEELAINWTVKNDQGTAGLQMTFDFSGVEYVKAKKGSAYAGTPQFNAKAAATTGEVNYAMADKDGQTADDDAVIYTFTVKAPESGKATVGMKTGTNINNKVVPTEDGKEHAFLFHGLTIDAGGEDTTKSSSSDTTKSTSATTKGSEVDISNTIIYNLVPASGDFTAVADNMTGNNTMTASAGEELTINWTVKKDQGTAGLQMAFDFSGVEYVKAKKGSAYAGTPQFNAKAAATTGEVNYAMADKDGQTAEDGAVIYSFTVKAPASGSATIAPMGNDNKVVPTEDGKEHKFLFHGLTINVSGGDNTTKTTASTEGSKVDITNTIIYNLVPASGDFTAVADDMTGNNTMTASAGEELTINWTVKKDQGTAGLQMAFDFSGVEYVKAKKGSAYAGTPQFNAKAAATTGEVNYAMADKDGQTAEDGAVIYSFTVKAPASGSATIAPMGNDNKVVPTEDGKEHKFLFHGLTINVSGGENTTKGSTASTEGSKVDITNTIIYNLVPASGDFTAVADNMTGNNTMKAAAGEEITVNWTVKQDQGTAGLQMTFDFSGVEYVKAKKGSAYAGTPQFNAKDAKTTGEVNYAMADKDGQTADDGAVIYSFTIKAPESGSATIGMKTGSNINNKVVPTEDGKEHKFLFHGLTINIGGDETTASSSSSEKTDSTSESKSTSGTESTKTTATTADVPAGSASWKIGKETAAAGADVKVPVTVSGDQGTAGIVAEFGFDTKLKFNGITWGEGYTGEATLNSKDGIAVWADANGADQKAKDNAVVLYLNFTAPAEAGTYDVTFKGLEVTNTAGKALTLTKDNGSVTVTGKVGSSNWTIGKETVSANAKVKVPVTVSGDEGTAGINVQFKADKALKFDGIEWAKGYTGDATINDKELIAVWGADANQKAKDNDVVLYLNFTAPAAAGEYPVEFAALEVCDENGAWLKVTKENGAVIVTDPKAGSATWIIGEEVAEAGAQVKVPVTVQGDTGSAGFSVEFANDSKLTFTGVEWGKGYTGTATINTNKKIVVWADANGANQKAANDAVVLYLLYTAPAQAGEYPVTFKDLSVSNEDGAFLALTKQDGKVIVKDPNAGSANWIIGKETCDKGATVKVPVTVKGDTGTAGFNVEFAYDQNLTFTGFEWAGKAYTGNATLNINKQIVVWADANGENQKAADDAVVLYLVFTAPEEEGTYPVRFVNFDSSDKAGVALVIEKENGWVKVGTTPTESTSESTQSTASTSATVSTSATDSTESTVSTSGAGSTESTVSTSGTGSTESTVSTSGTGATESTVSTSGTGSTVSTVSTSGTGSTVSTVSTSATVSDSSKSETSTTPVANVGNVVYQIAKVKAAAGTTAKVPVYVWYDTGTAGFTMEFAVPDGFKISGIEYGDAYTSANGEFTWDNSKRVLVWASADGANQTAKVGATIATLLIDVPAGVPAGIEYPVTFVKDSVSASDTERNLLKHQELDGSITIDPEVTKESTTVSTSANGSTESSVSTSATVSTQSTVSTSGNGSTESTVSTSGTVSTESTVSTSATVSTQSTVSTSATVSTESTVSTSATVPTSETNPNSETTPKVVTSYKFTFEPPTRVNYWSHDTRTFKDSNGLKGLAASLTVSKFYINDEGYFVNEKGVELVHVKYDAETGEIPGGVKPFETKTLDASAYTHPKETEDGPKKVWENEIKAQFGENYTAEQELKATHANKYPVKAYYFPSEQSDPDFNINNGEPVEFGEFKIYIGVKGDVNLDNVVSAEDPQLVLTYYTEKVLAFNESALINPEKKVDPEFEGEDGLCFYLGNVAFRDKDGKQVDPPVLDVEDAQNILNYYTEKYVTLIDTTTWESVVGYDLIDEFYGGVKEG